MRRYLLLQDGSLLEGRSFGSMNDCVGEIVFNTAFTGYYEIMTDPSYRGQILMFTFPEMFSYSYMEEIAQSDKIQASGIVIGNNQNENNRHFRDLDLKMKKFGIPGISGIDTRMLTQKIREEGEMIGWIINSPDRIPERSAEHPVTEVSPQSITVSGREEGIEILYLDLGTKISLLHEVEKLGRVTRCGINHSELIDNSFDIVFISNGPGDPSDPVFNSVIKRIQKIIGEVPVFGVCLGHQLMGRAFGLRTEKMPFGHHGTNHGVTDGRKTYVTSHNHSYRVSPSESEVLPMLFDVNDGTPEMFQYNNSKGYSVQFHPEGHPGPFDPTGFFSLVRNLIKSEVL
ncbi:carbamoyl phosphate synthase small subunit [Caldiplasma sukawensis]